MISLHIAGMYALSPVFGRLSDRLGAARVLACAAVLLTVAGVLCALAAPTATALLTCALVLLGLGELTGADTGAGLVLDLGQGYVVLALSELLELVHVDPHDVSALTACVDHVVAALS